MADERDPHNPIDQMMPQGDNPEYHRRKAAHIEQVQGDAEQAVMSDPAHASMSDRLTSRVRKSPVAAAAPTPMPPKDNPYREDSAAPPISPSGGQGLQIDPSMGQAVYNPIDQRLPEGAVVQQPIPAAPAALPYTPPPIAPPASSPLLARLREDFGIENIPLEDIKIGEYVFSMRVLDTASVATALRFADSLSMTDRENVINLQISLVAFAVLAINGEPLYKVFDVPVPQEAMVMVEGEKRPVFHPMAPPQGVRTVAATQFMEFLNTTASTSLLTELWKQYNDKVDPKGDLDHLLSGGTAEEVEEDIPLP